MGSNHLWLVGMMGAGKSSVGEASAARLQRGWLDTDDLIVNISGRSVAELFGEGEPIFREWESRAVVDASKSLEPLVISCGGGVVGAAPNRAVMAETGKVVWLRARPETLVDRVGDTSNRPLLGVDPLASLRRLASLRAPAYEAAADMIIETDDLTFIQVVDQVVAFAVSQP